MNPVKNQGSCGSCWAFGAIGAMEAAWNMAGNGKVVLGEQMLVDCSVGDCNGGWVDRALDHIINVGGAPMESDYPYTARNGKFHTMTQLKTTNQLFVYISFRKLPLHQQHVSCQHFQLQIHQRQDSRYRPSCRFHRHPWTSRHLLVC